MCQHLLNVLAQGTLMGSYSKYHAKLFEDENNEEEKRGGYEMTSAGDSHVATPSGANLIPWRGAA